MPWERAAAAGAVVLVAILIAKLVDVRMARRPFPPEAVTRYRVLRRSITAGIVALGVLSALLAIPQVRAIAGGILASSAVVGLVIGLAAQSTLSNFIAGILIAFSQPVRIGDRVELEGSAGIVEEIRLTYTLIRLEDGTRLVIPNVKLASDTIRNSTIVSPEQVAEISVQVPLNHDLGSLVGLLKEETGAEVFVSSLEGNARLTLRVPAPNEPEADRLRRELSLRVHERLRAHGVFA